MYPVSEIIMTITVALSIWLVPPAGEFKRLQGLCSDIATIHFSHHFQPHITLLAVRPSASISPDTLLPPLAELPTTSQLPVTFRKVCTGKHVFRTVLIEIGMGEGEGEGLSALYKSVVERNVEILKERGADTFGALASLDASASSSSAYYPHLSLYYGGASMDKKQAIVDDLYRTGVVRGDPAVTIAGVEGGFNVAEIWIVDTGGPIASWNVVRKIELLP